MNMNLLAIYEELREEVKAQEAAEEINIETTPSPLLQQLQLLLSPSST